MYLAMNKPRFVVTTMHDPEGRECVRDILPGRYAGVFPVGRLDFDAEGLLLLPNDGGMANALHHPSFDVPKTYVDNLNVVIICQQVRLANGSLARRLTSINEIVSYDSVSDSFSFIEVFNWNPVTDTFQFRGFQNSYLLENKIAPRRGLPEEKRRQIYKVLKQRSEVLKRMSEQGKSNFYDVYAVLSKAYKEGLFK
jgi:hypothetical protein